MKTIYKMEDYIGKRFGKWIILEDAGIKYNSTKMVKCQCECGTIGIIQLQMLLQGKSLQCIKCRNKIHGFSYNRLYRIWKGILARCYNINSKKYIYYGSRGIKVYKEWIDNYEIFEEWALNNGYLDTLTIDRIDTNGDYIPDNCRWVNMKIQILNRRKFKVNISGYTGIGFIKSTKKWKSTIGINYEHIHLGYYDTQKEALEARNKYIIDNGLNYPIQEYKGEIGSVNKE